MPSSKEKDKANKPDPRLLKEVKKYQEAVSENPENEDAVFGLGQALYRVGDVHGAMEQYENLRDLDEDLADQLLDIIEG